jgi:translation initiation factor 6 (eIF-6)
MATRCSFENSNEIGVFAALTNAYCLTGRFSISLLVTATSWLLLKDVDRTAGEIPLSLFAPSLKYGSTE